MSSCRSCGAEIVWVKMVSGRPMPCDAKPQKLVVLDDMPEPTGSVVDCYTPHWATCPHAEQHRKPQTTKAPRPEGSGAKR